MVGNIIPYIGGEEEKSEKEPLRLWGDIDGPGEEGEIVPANFPGHHLPVHPCAGVKRTHSGGVRKDSVRTRQKSSSSRHFAAVQRCSAGVKASERTGAVYPVISQEDDRPQDRLWMSTMRTVWVSTVGRLREDTVYDWKFVGLSHNTVRGAAGGAVLCAELLKAQGYITKK